MSTLSSANKSRCNGSKGGFGTLSGSIPKNDLRSTEEINDTHTKIKLMHAAQRIGDWDSYLKIQSTLSFN
jgi:hypothetical protein